MAELIQKQDTLNEGRIKLNAAITDAEQAKITADGADSKATQALANSESTQTQLDTIVINGDSSVEAAQARVDEKGVGHTTLKDRIDDGFTKVTSQLSETVKDGVTLSEFSSVQEAIDHAVSKNLPNIFLDVPDINLHNVDFKNLNVIGSNTNVTGSPKNIKGSRGILLKGIDQDVTQQGIFDNLSGTVSSKVIHKVSNDEIYVYSKKPYSNEYLEFQFKNGIYTENNSAGSPAELLRLTGVYNLTDAYSQLITPRDKSEGWDEYLVNINNSTDDPGTRKKQLKFQRHSSGYGYIDFEVYVNDFGDIHLGLYSTNGSPESVTVKVGDTIIHTFSARAVNGPYFTIKKINTNLRKGNVVIRIEKQGTNPLYICSNMYPLHETPRDATIDHVAFFDDGKGYITHHGAMDYAMIEDGGYYWGSFHGGETRSSFKLVIDGVNYSSVGHNGKFLVGKKIRIDQTTQIGSLFESRTSQQIGRDGFFDFTFALKGDANLRTIYTTMTTTDNAFKHVMFPRLQNVSADGEYYFGRVNKIIQENIDTQQRITTLFTRYENENNVNGGLFIRTTQGAYNKVYYGPVVQGLRNIKELHGENTRIFE